MVAKFTALASLLALVAAAPAADPAVTAAPAPVAFDKRATSCTFTAASAASASAKSCATIVLNNIAVPAGQTLDLSSAADNTHIIFSGTTTFGYEEWEGPLIRVGGSGQYITGASGHVINGNGPAWWDGKGGNGGKTKPKFFKAGSLTSSTIKGLNVKNTPVQAFSISGCNGLTVDSVTIDNSAGDANGLGHNTDAFDVGTSSDVTISNCIVHNQDDCLAVNSGTNIIFTGGSCTGGHGLSIGSVGGRDDNTVNNVTISNSKIINSQNGVRIKTVYGATGSVNDVTYSGITLSGITKYGIVIEQDYENGSPTGTPTAGVPITGLTLDGVTGTVTSSATDIYILCAKGACSNWKWEDVKVTGGKANNCTNQPSGVSC